MSTPRHCEVTGEPAATCECGGHDGEQDDDESFQGRRMMPPDTYAQVGYTHLRDGVPARTVEVTSSVNVDVDAEDHILGVETLGGADWRDALVTLAMSGRLAVPRRDRGSDDERS
jgi:hypothetical protein